MVALYELLGAGQPSRMGMIEGDPEYDPWSMQAARVRARYPTRLADPNARIASQGVGNYSVGFSDLPGFDEARRQAGNVYAGENYNPASLLQMAIGAVGAPGLVGGVPTGALGSGIGRAKAAAATISPEMEAYQALTPGSQAWREASYPGAKFGQYAEQYPPVGPPAVKLKDPDNAKFPGETFEAKQETPEAKALMKERARIIKQMDEEGYHPYFDPEKRFDVNPANYPTNIDTVQIVPKTLDTLSKHFASVGAEETRKALQNAYAKGVKLGGPGPRLTTQDWYQMGQLEADLVRQLGEKAGREAFKQRFATAMAATTGGMNPRSNLIAAGYHNYLASQGQQWPAAAHQWPSPVGARYGKELGKTAQRIMDEGGFQSLGEANPKRHNFAADFMGHTTPGTMDEQMTQLMQPGKTQPDWYGINEHISAQEAAKAGVDPRRFQETAWAGFKNEAGGPMIQEVNHTIERIHRLTGMPRQEIVRRGWGLGNIPIYGAAGLAAPSLLDLRGE